MDSIDSIFWSRDLRMVLYTNDIQILIQQLRTRMRLYLTLTLVLKLRNILRRSYFKILRVLYSCVMPTASKTVKLELEFKITVAAASVMALHTRD